MWDLLNRHSIDSGIIGTTREIIMYRTTPNTTPCKRLPCQYHRIYNTKYNFQRQTIQSFNFEHNFLLIPSTTTFQHRTRLFVTPEHNYLLTRLFFNTEHNFSLIPNTTIFQSEHNFMLTTY